MLRYIFIVIFLLFGIEMKVSGQSYKSLQEAEDSLSAVLSRLNAAKGDSARDLLNERFRAGLSAALSLQGSFEWPFASLKSLVRIASPDSKFRFFHWNLPATGGECRYYGFLVRQNAGQMAVWPLSDRSDQIRGADTAMLSSSDWFGALYYKVIPGITTGGDTLYTLLGWSGQDGLVTRKVIEILWFDKTGQPRFGRRFFPGFGEGLNARIIFRFSASAGMALKYEVTDVETAREWNRKKRTFETHTEKTGVIRADRLAPPEPQLVGQYRFYVADGELSDLFVFSPGGWRFRPAPETSGKRM